MGSEGARFMKARNMAAHLDMSPSTFYRNVRSGHLPAPVKIGRSRRWDRLDVESAIATRPEERVGMSNEELEILKEASGG